MRLSQILIENNLDLEVEHPVKISAIPIKEKEKIIGWEYKITCEIKEGDIELTEEERIDLLSKIKKHREPPFLNDDAYYNRRPWNKFGGVSSGICVCWNWYQDKFILENATDNDLITAFQEIEKEAIL